jgi:homoserine kinase type II
MIPGTLSGVLARWPLVDALVISEIFGGATNRMFKVEGSHGVAFLRCYRRPDPALVAREHAVIQQARLGGIPAARPLETRDGCTLVERDGAVYALYEAAQGEQVEHGALTREHARAAGEMLARLHRALGSLPDVGYLRWSLDWNGAAWCARLDKVEHAILARSAQNETDRWALERVRAQRAWLGQPGCRHHYQPTAPSQLTHGDYQDANLFFDSGRVSAVIDWEQAAFMPRAYEVVRACSIMFQLEPERTRAFIQAYSAEHPLGDAELEDGALAWGTFSDHHVWSVEEVYLHGNDAARRYIRNVPFRPFEQAWAEARPASAPTPRRPDSGL